MEKIGVAYRWHGERGGGGARVRAAARGRASDPASSSVRLEEARSTLALCCFVWWTAERFGPVNLRVVSFACTGPRHASRPAAAAVPRVARRSVAGERPLLATPLARAR